MDTFSALLAICAGIHRSPVNSPHKGKWCGALVFSLICAWINGWVNNRGAGDLRRDGTHYDVTVIIYMCTIPAKNGSDFDYNLWQCVETFSGWLLYILLRYHADDVSLTKFDCAAKSEFTTSARRIEIAISLKKLDTLCPFICLRTIQMSWNCVLKTKLWYKEIPLVPW